MSAPQFEIQEMLKGNTLVSARSEKLCLLERGSSKVTTLILSLTLRKSKSRFKEQKTELISRVESNSNMVFFPGCVLTCSLSPNIWQKEKK